MHNSEFTHSESTMLQQNPEPVDVAVVGFGPVGATLAALLGQPGLRVAVFDKSEQI